jgi:hypothetical protein
LLATDPTVPATLWTTPLLPFEDVLREAALLDDRAFLEAVDFARPFEPEPARLARERFDAAADRAELGRFDTDDLLLAGLDLLLALLGRALDERFVESAMDDPPFRKLCRSLPGGQTGHAWQARCPTYHRSSLPRDQEPA